MQGGTQGAAKFLGVLYFSEPATPWRGAEGRSMQSEGGL